MLQLLPPCFKCGKRLDDLYRCVGGCGGSFCKKEGTKIKIGKRISGKMIYGFRCHECQKNNTECGTSEIIKNEMTCKNGICINCKKQLK